MGNQNPSKQKEKCVKSVKKGVRLMKKIIGYEGINWGIDLEFKKEDLWFGVFYKKGKVDIDIWIIIFPFICFPIHYWSGREFK